MATTLPRVLCAPLAVLGVTLTVWAPTSASAAAPIGLGTATSFAVLAGTTATNTGPSTIGGDVGVSPGTALTGFSTATVAGTQHSADGVADQAQSDLTTAYNTAAGQPTTATVSADLGGQTLAPGVYTGPTLGLTGTLTLDAANDPNAIFVFQAGSTLTTASASVVALVRGANPCNVFWQVGSSATLGTDSLFTGSVLALTSISATTRATVTGRLLARNGATTLDSNTIIAPNCAAALPTPTATASPTASPTGSPTASAAPVASASSTTRATPSAAPVVVAGSPSPAAPQVGASKPHAPTGGHSTVVRQGTRGPQAVPPSELPHTGASIRQLAGAALLLLAGGLLLLALTAPRTRRQQA
jgi:hypothetical protein